MIGGKTRAIPQLPKPKWFFKETSSHPPAPWTLRPGSPSWSPRACADRAPCPLRRWRRSARRTATGRRMARPPWRGGWRRGCRKKTRSGRRRESPGGGKIGEWRKLQQWYLYYITWRDHFHFCEMYRRICSKKKIFGHLSNIRRKHLVPGIGRVAARISRSSRRWWAESRSRNPPHRRSVRERPQSQSRQSGSGEGSRRNTWKDKKRVLFFCCCPGNHALVSCFRKRVVSHVSLCAFLASAFDLKGKRNKNRLSSTTCGEELHKIFKAWQSFKGLYQNVQKNHLF